MPEGLIIHLAHVDECGSRFEGEFPAALLEAEEFSPTSPVRFDVEAQVHGEELLVRGCLSIDGTMPCGRCLTPLPVTVEVPDFTVLIKLPKDESVDLTDRAREDILLVLPAYLKCELDAEFRCPLSGRVWKELVDDAPPPPLGDQWTELDKLRLDDGD